MLNSMKSSAPKKDRNASANAAEVMRRMVQPYDPGLGEAGADDESGNRLLHWLRNVDRRQHRMQCSSAGLRSYQR
jgi:hypothetical protein